jgi:hypothetical protein
MSEQHGETHASNRGYNKDGWGAPIPAPIAPRTRRTPIHYTLLIPNNKAKHRSRGDGIVWRHQWNYIQNRYYVEYRPRLRAILKAIKFRK